MPIKYSPAVKKRAREIAPMCRSATNVLEALSREFSADQIPIDERTIRRWFKEQKVRYQKGIREHHSQMTDIARLLLDHDVGKVITMEGESDEANYVYGVVNDTDGYTEISNSQLVGRIEGNIDCVVMLYSHWHMWDCFAAHLEAEYPESKDFYGFLNTKTSTLINALKVMVERKTFKGTCPVCKEW
ncbi:hypothetical protein ACFLXG_00930 [Chloroflexota bacterium]